jgi:hypothetical protein
MNVNPQTYDSIITNGTSPHSLGEVWALMYFEVYWNLVNKHGFNPNIYDDWTTGGNNLALQLLLDGMKLQPCSPGMVDGRDAILAADLALTAGANQCEIWEGFAKRGLGFSADQGSSGSRTDGAEAFDLPVECLLVIPTIEVDPVSLSSNQLTDTAVTETLTISNTGTLDLLWSITEVDSSNLLDGGSSSWADNFDSYVTGSQMHGQGGWKGWDNSPAAGALTSDVQARSTLNSVDITGGSDLVHEYAGYTSGQWTYSTWQYIPTGYTGQTYFIILNTYADGGSNNWSTQVCFDAGTGMLNDDTPNSCSGSSTLPIIYDQWVQIRVEIDLDADTQTFYYNNQMLYQDTWTGHISGGGVANIGAVDLYANSASPVYYDDFFLTPAVTSVCDAPTDIPWATVSATSGTAAPAAASTVDVVFDSTGLATGVYTGTLCIDSNDPMTPLVTVPLTLTVEDPLPVYGVEIAATDDALTGTASAVVTYTVTVTNTGDITDSFTISNTGNSWATSLSAISLTLGAGESEQVMVMVTVPADAANNDTDTVTITAVSETDGSASDSVDLTTTAVVEETSGYTIYLPFIMNSGGYY